jgi:hypothetical protein
MRGALRAEALKLCTLPGSWLAVLLALVLPALLTLLDASQVRHAVETGDLGPLIDTSTTDSGFTSLILAQIGFVVLGVLATSSEYVRNAQAVGRGRQLTTSMTAVPQGLMRMIAKLVVLLLSATVLAIATTASTLAISRWALGELATDLGGALWSRCTGVVMLLVVMTMVAAALAELLRGGALALTLLIVNASAVSFTFLLSRITPLARYAPDLALTSSFVTDTDIPDPLEPATGMLVGAVWAVSAVVLTVLVHARRQA